jgi:hypothetical protein
VRTATNHWSDRRGSTTVSQREQCPEAERVEVRLHACASLEPVEALVGAARRADPRLGGHDVDRVEAVALPDLEVVRVVRRGDLHRAGAELHVDVRVGDDGDLPVHQRQEDRLADEVGVALVVGVDGDGGVAEHRLGAGRRDDDAVAAVRGGVAQVRELARVVAVVDLDVGQRGHAAGAPVDDAVAAVDEALVVEGAERRAHGPGTGLVEGEGLTRPVRRGAEAALLLQDRPAGLLLPAPHARDEVLPADVVAGEALGGELLLHDVLRRDARVVHAGQPHRVAPGHPRVPDERVLDRGGERVAEVQDAGDVRRRHRDRERLAVVVGVGAEAAEVLPPAVAAGLDLGRVVARGQLGADVGSHAAECTGGRRAPRRTGPTA